jgi:NAD(P)-dependent dehydrogenase (short-subunit alcohol dehydrogenase family)
MNDSYLKGQVIAVTGASRGIGLAAATSLLRRGARVALIARNRAPLETAVAALGSAHALAVVADVCDRATAAGRSRRWCAFGRPMDW